MNTPRLTSILLGFLSLSASAMAGTTSPEVKPSAPNSAPSGGESIEDLAKAAKDGDSDAMFKLGQMYVELRMYSKAREWFHRSASGGHHKAQMGLARLHMEKRIIEADEIEAFKWFLLAAEELPEAAAEASKISAGMTAEAAAKVYFSLYSYYEHNGAVRSTGQAQTQALAWLYKSAEAGHGRAQSALSRAYAFGRPGLPKDDDRALLWCRKAADQGDLDGLRLLADRYRTGRGVPKDEAEAFKLTRKAAELGFAFAQYEIGTAYDKGTGVEKNDAEAVKWYRLAAESGSVFSIRPMIELSRCLREGRGVAKDVVEAAKWVRIGGQINERYSGLPDSSYLRGVLEQLGAQLKAELDAEQTARVQKLAAEWRPRPNKAADADREAKSMWYVSAPDAEKAALKDSPELGESLMVIPVAVSRDGRGMATVTQCANPDPLAAKRLEEPEMIKGGVDTIEIWNTTSMTRLSRSGITGMAQWPGTAHLEGRLMGPFVFSPDGRQLLVGDQHEGVAVLRVPTLEKIGALSVQKPHLYNLGFPCAAFSAKGDLVFTAYGPFNAPGSKGGQVWNATDLKMVREFDVEDFEPGICLSPDEKFILTAESGNRVHLWDALTGRQVAEFHPKMGILRAAAFHPSGKFVAFAGEAGAAVLEVIRDGDKVRLDHLLPIKFAGFPMEATGVRSIAYSPDGRYLGVGHARDHLLRIVEVAAGKSVGAVPQLAEGPVLFTPDSKAVWLASPKAPMRFEIAHLSEQSYRDMHAIIAAGSLFYWAQLEQAGALKSRPAGVNDAFYNPQFARTQALGMLAPGFAKAAPLVAKLLDFPEKEIQMCGMFGLAAIGEEVLKTDPSLRERLRARSDPRFARQLMPWLFER